jgi:hypothetical protein
LSLGISTALFAALFGYVLAAAAGNSDHRVGDFFGWVYTASVAAPLVGLVASFLTRSGLPFWVGIAAWAAFLFLVYRVAVS